MIKISGITNDGSVVSIFDLTGRLIKKLPVTQESLVWDGSDFNGNSVSTGIYFARLEKINSAVIKMLLVK